MRVQRRRAHEDKRIEQPDDQRDCQSQPNGIDPGKAESAANVGRRARSRPVLRRTSSQREIMTGFHAQTGFRHFIIVCDYLLVIHFE